MVTKDICSYEVVARRIKGSSHKINGKNNQDNYLIRELGEITIVSVADGHGSEKCFLSEYGSKIATHVFCDMITSMYLKSRNSLSVFYDRLMDIREEQLPKHLIKNWQIQVTKDYQKRNAIQTKITDESEIIEKYGTTLIGLVLSKEFYFACQIGDGDIIAKYDEGKTARLISTEKFLGVETKSMCSKNAWIDVEISFSRPSNNLELPVLFLIATDGLSNSYVNDKAFLKIAEDYLRWIKTDDLNSISHKIPNILRNTSIKGSGDDITLAIIANMDRIREKHPNELSI